MTTAPATVGICRILPGALARFSSLIGPSDAPKSTVCARICFCPPPGADGLIIEPHGGIDLCIFIEPFRINRIREGRTRAVDHHLRRSACAHSQRNCQPKKSCFAEFRHAAKLPQFDSAGQRLYCYVCVTTALPGVKTLKRRRIKRNKLTASTV